MEKSGEFREAYRLRTKVTLSLAGNAFPDGAETSGGVESP